jgi:hypothetical protein
MFQGQKVSQSILSGMQLLQTMTSISYRRVKFSTGSGFQFIWTPCVSCQICSSREMQFSAHWIQICRANSQASGWKGNSNPFWWITLLFILGTPLQIKNVLSKLWANCMFLLLKSILHAAKSITGLKNLKRKF